MARNNDQDLLDIIKKTRQTTSGINSSGRNYAPLMAIRKRYMSEVDNINATRTAVGKKKRTLFPDQGDFDSLHWASSVMSAKMEAACPHLFDDHYDNKNKNNKDKKDSWKMKFNRLAIRSLEKAVGFDLADQHMSIIGKRSSHGMIVLIRSSSPQSTISNLDPCKEIMRIVRSAGFDDSRSRAMDEVVATDPHQGLFFKDNNNNNKKKGEDLVLKVEHLPDVDTAETAFKENEIHRQLCEHVEFVSIPVPKDHQKTPLRIHHVFRGKDVFPRFISGSTVLLSKLIADDRDKTDWDRLKKKLMADAINDGMNNLLYDETIQKGADVHYRFTFMSHVDNATTLVRHLSENMERLNAKLFVQIEHAVLTMWFAGYAHCDFHAGNVLIVKEEEQEHTLVKKENSLGVKELIAKKEQGYKKPNDTKTKKEGTNKKSIDRFRPVIIDFGYCIKLEGAQKERLKSWWVQHWRDPDVVGAYNLTSELVKQYAIRRMWDKGRRSFNWEGNFLQCVAQRLDGRAIVRKRLEYYGLFP
jgi:hypothetical protein